MAVTSKRDQRVNFAAILVTESAANTQTSKKFDFPYSVMDKMALNISRVEYWIGNTQLNGTGDQTVYALTTASTVVSMENQADPTIIDSMRTIRIDTGTAANSTFRDMPLVKDFSNLPGGGLLVAPAPLYAMIQSTGAAAAEGFWMKIFYTYISLSTDEYWELVESRRIISS